MLKTAILKLVFSEISRAIELSHMLENIGTHITIQTLASSTAFNVCTNWRCFGETAIFSPCQDA